MTAVPTRTRSGFTLVEALLVVAILGVLAATIVPPFCEATRDAQETALRQDLQLLRSQIQLYKFQHNGRCPGHGSTDPQTVIQQLTKATDLDGRCASPGSVGHPYGPYLAGQFPINPYNGGRNVKLVENVRGTLPTPLEAHDSDPIGWLYNPATGEIKANATGATTDGRDLDSL